MYVHVALHVGVDHVCCNRKEVGYGTVGIETELQYSQFPMLIH